MADTPGDLRSQLADLRRVRWAEISIVVGDSVLETTLRRVLRVLESPREAVSGFTSAI